ncbi:MAG: AhpC/TSA family protein [Bacteroidales bacterium]|nr:AhpC/TSA family protein [Bacteroidales bacterium]MBR5782560.1 AhpC/TSA family protein [Bacteroidales bacterium]
MKKILICTLVLFSFLSCSRNKFTVDLEMQNANGKTAYLQRMINNELINIDSALIENNKASFKIKKSDNNDAYHLYIKGWRRAVPFFADNQNVMINGDFNAYHKIGVTASETQTVMDEINRKLSKADDQVVKMIVTEYALNNRDNELAPYLIYKYKWAFKLNDFKELIKHFSRDFNSGYYEKIKEYIQLLERTNVGQPYIDFTLNNIDGEAVTLSEIVGNSKLVMIDFWASWCPDCRVENPNVVETYELFKDKGLEIVSVSLDTDKEAWLKGIKDDNLSWNNHLSALQGWNCPAANEYGVAFIPQNFIINKDGIIIGKNISGENLKHFIARHTR